MTAACAVSPARNSSTSFGSTGIMIPNDNMSRSTVTRLSSTAARRDGVTVVESVMADASYQARTPGWREKIRSRSATALRLLCDGRCDLLGLNVDLILRGAGFRGDSDRNDTGFEIRHRGFNYGRVHIGPGVRTLRAERDAVEACPGPEILAVNGDPLTRLDLGRHDQGDRGMGSVIAHRLHRLGTLRRRRFCIDH